MTKQEAFDRAYRGLKSQGFRRALNKRGQCRLKTHNGARCALGHAMKRDEYHPDLEARPDEDLRPRVRSFMFLPKRFITRLRVAHDRARTPNDMKARLAAVARAWRLTIPSD